MKELFATKSTPEAYVLQEDKVTFLFVYYTLPVTSVISLTASFADNDMINGTKLLNVVGMSRGKRDGILKNEKGRVVVKVGSMHLKGVWYVR